MPWTRTDYPSSMKNLEAITKKKAIDIANSMLDEGYEESRAIPIAIEQAKQWRKQASTEEINQYKNNGKPTKRSSEGKQYENNPERLEEGEHVVAHEGGWAVRSSNGKKPSNVFQDKHGAIQRARKIAKNKGTYLIVHRQDGSIEEKKKYAST
ncbi:MULTISPECIES: DUF2188 domain-containing protein [Virgibacillus]|uniref:DUF2188 domain-containing protein n=2 Tax=Virgibacillus TaxID=84406 RepID=A0A024QGF7_9BACI|nr:MULTISPECIES: DUF2188 domain-containing protein [Virgibacillus]EQB38890.1 hypothetical protein M948_00675 [Virgibacillus sp. CM-4]MYL43257.1 DUF2188 domain-containing protein [Virgibacillus massiliensis]GGJ66891.1 hypothetical protein GCM10007111_31070 [Virgibacillus kapii]CDQ41016.1 hypothetical protein BN990_03366 [Virgibacillus massiliensis]